jgi:hypothetical protein
MVGAATHMYNPNSDVSGGWGFYEKMLPCKYLSRVQLSNRVITPPNHIGFDPEQDEGADGNYFGASWVGMPVFGGKLRHDEDPQEGNTGRNEPIFDPEGELSWTFTIDSEQFKGPLVAMVPEHFYRAIDEFNAFEDKIQYMENGGCCTAEGQTMTEMVADRPWCTSFTMTCEDWCRVEYDKGGGWFNELKNAFDHFTHKVVGRNAVRTGCLDPACGDCEFCRVYARQPGTNHVRYQGGYNRRERKLVDDMGNSPFTDHLDDEARPFCTLEDHTTSSAAAPLFFSKPARKGPMQFSKYRETSIRDFRAALDFHSDSRKLSDENGHAAAGHTSNAAMDWSNSGVDGDLHLTNSNMAWLGKGRFPSALVSAGSNLEEFLLAGNTIPPYSGENCVEVGALGKKSMGRGPAKGYISYGAEFLDLPVFKSEGWSKIPEFTLVRPLLI